MRRGLLIRKRAAFDRACLIDTIVFDKTGTLIEGRFAVTDVPEFGPDAEAGVLRLAAAVEQRSERPITAGLVQSARERGIDASPAKRFETSLAGACKPTLTGRRSGS